jgi:hypothetical protein
MRLEKKRIWLVGRRQKNKDHILKEFTVLSAFSTKEEARNKLNWYVDTYTKSCDEYEIQEIETWFPSEC